MFRPAVRAGRVAWQSAFSAPPYSTLLRPTLLHSAPLQSNSALLYPTALYSTPPYSTQPTLLYSAQKPYQPSKRPSSTRKPHSTPLYSTLLNGHAKRSSPARKLCHTLLCSAPLCSALLFPALPYSTPPRSTPPRSAYPALLHPGTLPAFETVVVRPETLPAFKTIPTRIRMTIQPFALFTPPMINRLQ